MSITLKGRIEELRATANKLEKVLEQHPHAYLAPIEYGREEWVAISASSGPGLEFTSDPRYPGRVGSISLHRYEEVEGVRVYAPPGTGRNAEHMFKELQKNEPELFKALMDKVFD